MQVRAICVAAACAVAMAPAWGARKSAEPAWQAPPVLQAQPWSPAPIDDAPVAAQKGIAPQTFVNPTSITITDCPNPCPASGQAASVYPSSINVNGVSGVVRRVTVSLNGLTHAFPSDTDFMLVSPSGRRVMLMSDFGGQGPGVSNINVFFDDFAARPVPSLNSGITGTPFVAGEYRPSNSGVTDVFPAPAPGNAQRYTLSSFNGDAPNGTWSLYIIDDASGDAGVLAGGWSISFWQELPNQPSPGDIVVDEFRTRGVGTNPPASGGSADEFIELRNTTDRSITIVDAVLGADPTAPAGAGWRVSFANGAATGDTLLLAQDSSTNGPIALAPYGSLLIATQPSVPNPAGNAYSLTPYPTASGYTTSGTANLPISPSNPAIGLMADVAGIAVYRSGTASAVHRLDSVGFAGVLLSDFKEGSGLLPAGGIVTPSQHSFVRRRVNGLPQDTDDNAADFELVDPDGGVLDGVPAVLGSPGPQRGHTTTTYSTSQASFFEPGRVLEAGRIDPAQPASAPPNLVVDGTPTGIADDGTIKFRRAYINRTGKPLTALRFRVLALPTLRGGSVPAGSADLRVFGSPAQNVMLTDNTVVSLQPLLLQSTFTLPGGGGVNSSLLAQTISSTAPLNPDQSIFVEFTFGVVEPGPYRIEIVAEGAAADGVGGASVIEVFESAPLAPEIFRNGFE